MHQCTELQRLYHIVKHCQSLRNPESTSRQRLFTCFQQSQDASSFHDEMANTVSSRYECQVADSRLCPLRTIGFPSCLPTNAWRCRSMVKPYSVRDDIYIQHQTNISVALLALSFTYLAVRRNKLHKRPYRCRGMHYRPPFALHGRGFSATSHQSAQD